MKVALVTNYWKNSEGGGIKTYLVNLVDALKDKGVEVVVLYREGDDPEHFHCDTNKALFSWSCYLQLRKIQPDVIHSQGSWFCLLPGYLYKKINKCKLIHTFHTEPINKLPFPGKWFFQRLLNACDCVTFVSKRLEDKIKEVYDLKFKRTAITYAGAQIIEVSANEVRQFYHQYSLKQDNIILLASGMTALLYKAQGLKILIQSIIILKKSYTNIVLIVTRKGQYYEELIKYSADLGLEGNVVFTGDMDNPYIPLTICNIYTHITLGEGGVSISLLEAMAMGKPIIATPIGGIPEAIVDGENGILVEPDAEQIAKKIEFLLNDRTIAVKLGTNARLAVCDKFTWEKTADCFMSLFTK